MTFKHAYSSINIPLTRKITENSAFPALLSAKQVYVPACSSFMDSILIELAFLPTLVI